MYWLELPGGHGIIRRVRSGGSRWLALFPYLKRLIAVESTETRRIFVISGRAPTRAPSRSHLSLRAHWSRHRTNWYRGRIRYHRLQHGAMYPPSGSYSEVQALPRPSKQSPTIDSPEE